MSDFALPALPGALNEVYNVDALTLLKALPDASVDLVFLDPPYNLGYSYDNHNDKMPDAEYEAWCHSWLDECVRVLSPTGSLFMLHIPRWAIPLGAFLSNRLVFQHWIAWKAASRNANKALMPEHYALLYYTKTTSFTVHKVRARHKRCRTCGELIADYGGKKHLIHPYGPQISDVWTDISRAKHGQRGKHPCKLPDKLVRRVLEVATNPGDIALDPFAGTGTTLYVAAEMGRQFIGCDISAEYVAMARQRLAQPYTLNMFEMAGAAD